MRPRRQVHTRQVEIRLTDRHYHLLLTERKADVPRSGSALTLSVTNRRKPLMYQEISKTGKSRREAALRQTMCRIAANFSWSDGAGAVQSRAPVSGPH